MCASCTCLQVRSYTRGTVVRTIDTETRTKLLSRLARTDDSSLRSFLDGPAPKGLTVQGSGDFRYHLTKRNNTRRVVHEGSVLHQQVHTKHVPMLYTI